MQRSVHVFFSGRVQGVGFRFNVLNLARKYSLTGWVKNLPDRRVELTAEGRKEDLDFFLSDLGNTFKSEVVNCQVEEREACGGWSNFQILF